MLAADILNAAFGRKSATFERLYGIPNRGASDPFIRCSVNSSGGSTVYTCSRMKMRGAVVQIEVAPSQEIVRLRIAPEGQDGVRVSSGGTFSGPTSIHRVCGCVRILVSQDEDGWWYGSFAEEDLV